jgi:hypothetical protein
MTLLQQQQQWFDHVMHRRGGVPSWVVASPNRMQLVVEMTWIRLVDAMAELFPRLRAALGEARFRTMALAYLSAHPSRVHDLDDVGIQLPSFLAAGDEDLRPWSSLAAFERAKTRAFSAPNDPVSSTSAAMSMEQLMASSLHWSNAAELISITPTVAAQLELAAEACVLCMHRRHEVVHWRRFDTVEVAWHQVLSKGPLPFLAACEQLSSDGHQPQDVALRLSKLQGDQIVVLLPTPGAP